MTSSHRLAFAYIRVSTSKQERYSPAEQERILVDYARRQGWRFEVHRETGSGERIEGRPVFAALLARIVAGEAHTLLVIEAERLTRPTDLRELATIHEACRAGGCRIATPGQTLDLSDAEDTFLSTLFGALAAREKAKMRQRQQRGLDAARAAGRWQGGRPPLGYLYDRQRRTLVLDPASAGLVRELLERAVHVGASRLAAEFPTLPWRGVSRAIARRRLAIYAARVPQPDGSTVRAAWEPLISDELARQINAARDRRREHPDHHPGARRLLSGLGVLRCGCCGRTLRVASRSKRLASGRTAVYHSYFCKRPRDGQLCPGRRSVACWRLDRAVLRVLWRLVPAALAAPRRGPDPTLPLAPGVIAALESAQGRRDRLVAAVEAGTLTPAEARERLDAVRREIAGHERRLEVAEQERPRALALPREALAILAADPAGLLETQDGVQAGRALIRAAVRRVEVAAGRVVVTLISGHRGSANAT